MRCVLPRSAAALFGCGVCVRQASQEKGCSIYPTAHLAPPSLPLCQAPLTPSSEACLHFLPTALASHLGVCSSSSRASPCSQQGLRGHLLRSAGLGTPTPPAGAPRRAQEEAQLLGTSCEPLMACLLCISCSELGPHGIYNTTVFSGLLSYSHRLQPSLLSVCSLPP